MSGVRVSGVTPATTVSELIAAAMPTTTMPTTTAKPTTTMAPTTTAKPTTTLKPGECPANYIAGTVPNPDLAKVYDGDSTGDGYKVTGNENYFIKPPAQLANITSWSGWKVCVKGGDLPPNTTIMATVKGFTKDAGGNGFHGFKFSPTLPGLFGNHQMAFFFAPTLTGGRRGRRGSRRGRKGRKGTRRH